MYVPAFREAVVLTNMMMLNVSQSVIFCSFALQLQRESDICIFFHIPTEFPWGANPCNPNSGSHWVQFNEFLICAHQKFIFHASGQHKALDQSLEFMSTAKSALPLTFGTHESDLIDTFVKHDEMIWLTKTWAELCSKQWIQDLSPGMLPHVASTMLLHSKVWHC